MSQPEQLIIGTKVVCSDGDCGELKRVVIDPVARAITHLVVEPKHREASGRLVPIDLVSSTGDEIRLQCTRSEFQALDQAEESHFLPGASGPWGYPQGDMLTLPYYGLGGLGPGLGGLGMSAGPYVVISDRVPPGEVEVRRGDHVRATDGNIGRVKGLVVDPSDHHVTHFLLDEGHLWGEKRVAIPIGAVKSVEDGVQVTLSKDQVRDLPPVEIDQPE